jgi:O-antigen/teichoic acid export membrane protein
MIKSSPTNSEIKKGSFYLLLSATIVKFEEFLANIIIARWLFPEDFGLYGLIIMVLSLFSTLGNWGIGTFLIYKKEENVHYLPTALAFNVVLTTALAFILFTTSPLTASFFNDGRLINLQIIAGFIFIFQSLSIIPHALLQTHFRLS